MRRYLFALVAMILSTWVATARADDATVLVLQIQRELRTMARDLNALGDASADEGDVENVAEDLWDLVEPLVDLIYENEGNHQAERIVELYPSSMDDLLGVLVFMRDMKREVVGFEAKAYIHTCERAWPREMAAELQKRLESDPETERDDLVAIAEHYAGNAEEYVDTAKALVKQLDGLRDKINRYRPDHRDFTALGNALGNAADDIVKEHERARDDIEKTCGKLVDYEDLQAFKDADQVLEDIGVAIAEFEADAEEWLKANGGLFDAVCETIRTMRNAYCRKDWEPEENSRAIADYNRLADNAAADTRRIFDGLISEFERNLRDRGRTLSAYDDDTEALYEKVAARHAALRKYLYGSTVLKGANHPKVRLWAAYGIQQHERMTNKFNCNVANKRVPGLSDTNMPDCIDIRNCIVIEFKPGTDQGLRDGGKNSVYVSGLNAWLTAEYPKYASNPLQSRRNSRNMGFDSEFIEQARAWGCFDKNGKGNFGGDALSYEPCDKDNDLQCKP